MTENLKICPFCGGEAFLVDDDEKNYGVYIACSKCCSSTEIFKTKDEALISWNTRQIEDELHGKIGKLEAENARLCETLEEISRGFDSDSRNYTREQMMRIAKEALK